MGPHDDRQGERHAWVVRASDGSQVGPVSIGQIVQARALGRLTDDAEVRNVHATSWERVGSLLARVRLPSQAQVDGTGQMPALGPASEAPPRSAAEEDTSPGLAVRRAPLGGLFDFTFTTFFTLRIVGVLYAVVLLVAAGYLLACEYFGVTALLRAGTMDATLAGGVAVVLILAGPIGAALTVIVGRVALEFIVVTFRISETLTEIKAKTR